MTGRDLYRKYAELKSDEWWRDEWWRLSPATQLAWEDLAEWVTKQLHPEDKEEGAAA
jgi:hypothetical protein